MELALAEARQGWGLTSPNPAVGAVLVEPASQTLLACGHHRRAGEAHAEIEALRNLIDPGLAQGATLYVTLEPCSTHGRTPPCTQAIIEAGIRRVVIGTLDPNPRHAGKALPILRKAGIEVIAGVCESSCAQLNEAFNKWIVTGQPLVIAKAAMSWDGVMIRRDGQGPWITSEAARRHAHRNLRAIADAIVTGGETVRADNPSLTVRTGDSSFDAKKKQPWRVVWSRRFQRDFPTHLQLFADVHRERTIIRADENLAELLAFLGTDKEATCVLIEGGPRLLQTACEEGVVDRICVYLAPLLLGGNIDIEPLRTALPITDQKIESIGDNFCLTGRVSA